MTDHPGTAHATAHAKRRDRLADKLNSGAALVPAGAPSPRNYAAAAFPFRPGSHFLYLFGVRIPGAYGLWVDGKCTLYTPDHPSDAALWEGQSETRDELAQRLGCPVLSTGELEKALAERTVGTVPAVDAASRAEQSRRMGRNVAARQDQDLVLIDALIELRIRHDEAAQSGLRRAARATASAHRAGMRATRTGSTEAAVRAAMEYEFLLQNFTTAYQPIVTVHGEVLHNNHYSHSLGPGDLLLADVGAETDDGWAGDVTRTWPVSAKFSTTQRELYEVVLAAQKKAIAMAMPGTRYRDVHLGAARELAAGLVALGILRGDPDELVADGVHALFFPHGIGHLIGLDVHDMEDLGDRAGYAPGRERSEQFGLGYLRLDRDLVSGMAVTIEPGFYQVPAILQDPGRRDFAGERVDWKRLSAFSDVRGIRIEDDLLITATGNEVLTDGIPKEAAAIEAAVGG